MDGFEYSSPYTHARSSYTSPCKAGNTYNTPETPPDEPGASSRGNSETVHQALGPEGTRAVTLPPLPPNEPKAASYVLEGCPRFEATQDLSLPSPLPSDPGAAAHGLGELAPLEAIEDLTLPPLLLSTRRAASQALEGMVPLEAIQDLMLTPLLPSGSRVASRVLQGLTPAESTQTSPFPTPTPRGTVEQESGGSSPLDTHYQLQSPSGTRQRDPRAVSPDKAIPMIRPVDDTLLTSGPSFAQAPTSGCSPSRPPTNASFTRNLEITDTSHVESHNDTALTPGSAPYEPQAFRLLPPPSPFLPPRAPTSKFWHPLFPSSCSSVSQSPKVTGPAHAESLNNVSPTSGSSSSLNLQALDLSHNGGLITQWEAERRPARIMALAAQDAFTFLPRAATEALLGAYFRKFHTSFAIVDEPEIVRQHKNSTLSPLLLQAMLFIGASLCEEEDVPKVRLGTRDKATFVLYNRAKDLYDSGLEQDKLVIIQALFLMSFWKSGVPQEKDTRHWLGAALSLAQTARLHRSYLPSSTRINKLRKRIWWSIYARERQCAGAMGLPNRIRDEDCDVTGLHQSDFENAFNPSMTDASNDGSTP